MGVKIYREERKGKKNTTKKREIRLDENYRRVETYEVDI